MVTKGRFREDLYYRLNVISLHLPPLITQARPYDTLPSIPGATMLDFERYAIVKTFEATGGSLRETAAALGISIRKLQYRLKEYRRSAAGDAPAVEPSSNRPRRIGFRSRR